MFTVYVKAPNGAVSVKTVLQPVLYWADFTGTSIPSMVAMVHSEEEETIFWQKQQ